MKVNEVINVLLQYDGNLDVSIEQVFREQRSITLRSIEVVNGCVVLKDHYVRQLLNSNFVAFDGTRWEVPSTVALLVEER